MWLIVWPRPDVISIYPLTGEDPGFGLGDQILNQTFLLLLGPDKTSRSQVNENPHKVWRPQQHSGVLIL